MNVKFRIFFIILLNNILFSNQPDTNLKKNVSIVGTIKLPEEISADACLYICYNGEVVKIKEGETTFLLKDNEINQINILFTSPEDIDFCAEENTILCLKLANQKDYKFFKLIKKTKESENKKFISSTWEIHEKDLIIKKNKKNDAEIPLNTLIVPMNPNNVTIELENVSWKQSTHFLKLPIINIKTIKGKENINEQLLKSCLAFINLRPFHAKQTSKKREIQQDNTKVSILIDE